MLWCCCQPTVGCPAAYYDPFNSFAPDDINDVDIPLEDHWHEHGWITRNVAEPFFWARAVAGKLEQGLEPAGSTTYVSTFRCFEGRPISSYSPERLGEWYELEVLFSEFDNGLAWVAGDAVSIALLGGWDISLVRAGFWIVNNSGQFYWHVTDAAGGSTTTAVIVASGQVLRQRLEIIDPGAGSNFCQQTAFINGIQVAQSQHFWSGMSTKELASVTVGARWGKSIKIDYWNQTSSFM